MAYADDLLALARDIATLAQPPGANQAALRRAISTAYYALFHLLVSDAVANWANPESRSTLARHFSHGPMKTACSSMLADVTKTLKRHPRGAPAGPAGYLRTVASTFIQAQERREEADYDLARTWTPKEVALQIDEVEEAFGAWGRVHNEPEAQALLVAMLGSRNRR